ncbi:MAG: TdeIII family type II restriction endonuclease [Oscillospiraceae bacterium]|nr:TdeIII family type II restriction endonuclease [Oscillospiraceae bacterium]
METNKRKAIEKIVDENIKNFADGLEARYKKDKNNPSGNINTKRNNCFIAELGDEFTFHSAFARSFDSSFGNILEKIGNAIAKHSYEVYSKIDSYLLPQQSQHIDYLMTEYNSRVKPKTEDYTNFTCLKPKNIESYITTHQVDNHFFKPATQEHFVI